MEVHLLRDLLNDALNDPDEKSRIGSFWVFAEDYDECIPILKKIFFDKEMKEIFSDECNVKRINETFFIEDPYGGKDIFTNDEMELVIHLWEKSWLVEPNIIDDITLDANYQSDTIFDKIFTTSFSLAVLTLGILGIIYLLHFYIT